MLFGRFYPSSPARVCLLIFVTRRSNYIYTGLHLPATRKLQLRKRRRTQSLSCVCHQEWVNSRLLAISWTTPKWRLSCSSNGLLWGIFSFHVLLCYNQTIMFSLAVASFSEALGLAKNRGFFHVSLLAACSSCLKTAWKILPRAPPIFLSLSPCQKWLSIQFRELSFDHRTMQVSPSTGHWMGIGWGWGHFPSLKKVCNCNWSLQKRC